MYARPSVCLSVCLSGCQPVIRHPFSQADTQAACSINAPPCEAVEWPNMKWSGIARIDRLLEWLAMAGYMGRTRQKLTHMGLLPEMAYLPQPKLCDSHDLCEAGQTLLGRLWAVNAMDGTLITFDLTQCNVKLSYDDSEAVQVIQQQGCLLLLRIVVSTQGVVSSCQRGAVV